MKNTFVKVFLILLAFAIPFFRVQAQTAFRFASISDSHVEISNFTKTVNQIKSLTPNFVLFNGDLENDGVINTQMDPMINVLKTAGLYNGTFFVRGNHDDHLSGSAALWQTYFSTTNPRTFPSGITNYVGIDANNSHLTYSFDYGNSRFIGIDNNQYADPPTSAQTTFLHNRLVDAESLGLTHAFIFFHGPEYCVESTHCSCQTRTSTSSSCNPQSNFLKELNEHPIISATFHGHEHVLGWVHMDNTRVSGLTRSYEEFFTSTSGNPYSFTFYPNRLDWYYPSSTLAFGLIDVSGSSFTVNLYTVGSTTPTLAWSKIFTKAGSTPVPTPTPGPATPTPTKTPTPTPTTGTNPTPTPPPGTNTRPTKYYGVDRVLNNADFAKLAAWGVNTAVVAISTNGSTSSWQSTYDAAHNAGVNIVIWPLDPGGDNICGWESPFNNPVNGNYISTVTNMLNWWAAKPGVIGITTFHEPMWSTSAGCKDSIVDLSAIYSQIHAYTNNPNFLIFGYINTLNASTIRSGDGGGTGVADYTGPADLAKIMDVAVIWQHCAGGVEGPCEGSNSTLSRINESRTILNSVNSPIKLLFIQQTFTTGGYGTKFTLDQLQKYSCDFLNSSALDGFAYYTWDAGWWPDLHSWTDLQPAVPYVNTTCVNHGSVPTISPSITVTPVPTPVVKPGDANGDGKVDETDYGIWLSHFGQIVSGVPNGDFNGDGHVDGIDYTIWLLGYGK